MKHEPRLSGDDIEYASESLTCRINAFAEEIRKDLRAAALMADAAMQQARRPDAQISDVTDAAIAIRASAIASDRGLSEIENEALRGLARRIVELDDGDVVAMMIASIACMVQVRL